MFGVARFADLYLNRREDETQEIYINESVRYVFGRERATEVACMHSDRYP